MTSQVTRRAFLAGLVGAATAGWLWLRNGGGRAEPAVNPAISTPSTTERRSTTTSRADVTTSSTTTTTTETATSTTQAALATVTVLCRDAWRAEPARGGFTDHQIEHLTVHHTARLLEANRMAPAAIRGHQRFHQDDRGWADIAYHYLIDLEGNVYEGRPVTAVGDTGTNYDPTGHFLVACEGDFSRQPIPDAMRESLVMVLAWAADTFGVDPSVIRGHRDLAATTCPGDDIYSLIENGHLQADVAALRFVTDIRLELICGAEASDRVMAIEA